MVPFSIHRFSLHLEYVRFFSHSHTMVIIMLITFTVVYPLAVPRGSYSRGHFRVTLLHEALSLDKENEMK